MAIITRADYIASLKRLRPNVFKFGQAIEDVTAHPATRRVVESHGLTFVDWNQPKLALPSGAFADMTHTTDQGSALFAARLFARIRSLFDRGGGR